jgi:hypothetical protein
MHWRPVHHHLPGAGPEHSPSLHTLQPPPVCSHHAGQRTGLDSNAHWRCQSSLESHVSRAALFA